MYLFIILQAHHDHNKIAPCGMINVFLIELNSCLTLSKLTVHLFYTCLTLSKLTVHLFYSYLTLSKLTVRLLLLLFNTE